ncbi:Nuclear transcription factor Y subunit C-2 [Mycena sanguinolenta]|uniref:Nuclear transcription factor Y subunit C-2 n=1 Tax=Mycena sanguinolenta TaxID=230812 RepID=A0A8H6Y8X3_9AGAR|nr:Nuclear transcription factor Y subunit C-2 [Mycena sanguinolenta]
MASQPYVQTGEPLNDFLRSFWQRQIDAAEQETPDYRHPPLPLARIKKVMKSDPDVKMIAADAPILFCKACEIFIAEITARAFIIADSNKRRTLSRADIAKALTKSDQFDFLIDIVPREEPFAGAASASGSAGSNAKRQPVSAPKREPVSSPMELEPTARVADGEGDAPQDSARGSEVLDQLESLLAAGPAPRALP